jgi:hypothetical protein
MILVSAFFEFRRDLAVREERRRELDFLEKVVVTLVSLFAHIDNGKVIFTHSCHVQYLTWCILCCMDEPED